MIKANELRIGNYVYDDENVIVKVERIHSDLSAKYDELAEDEWVSISKKGSDSLYFSLVINPIPLTPEILEKCGFRYLNSNNGRGMYWVVFLGSFESEDTTGELSYWPGGAVLTFNYAMSRIGEYTNYTETPYPHIKHLHQLQNLYFALTGEELQVNL